jgi:phytoene/squalene synthetase
LKFTEPLQINQQVRKELVMSDRQRQAAIDQLLAAMQAVRATGLYKNVEFVAMRTMVDGRNEDVTCVVFADFPTVLACVEARICNPTTAELAGHPPASIASPYFNRYPGRKLH